MRKFEVANKVSNGQIIGKWDVVSLPVYATKNAAGADFFAAESITIPSFWSKLMSSGFKDTTRFFSNELRNLLGERSPINIQNLSQEESKTEMQPTLVHTGIKACMEEDEVLYIFNRSSNPKKLGLVLANSVGVIDSDYYGNPDNDGEIMFAYYNFFPFDVTIQKGDRIGQGVFQKYLRAENAIISDVDRSGGFGSTGTTEADAQPQMKGSGGVVLSKKSESDAEKPASKFSLNKEDKEVTKEVTNEVTNEVANATSASQSITGSVVNKIKRPLGEEANHFDESSFKGTEGLGEVKF